MKGFSKFLFVIGVLMLFLSLGIALAKGSLVYTYYEFEEDLMTNEYFYDLTDDEIEARYEDYLVANDDATGGINIFVLMLGLGFIAAAIGIVYIDRAFKKNELGQFGDRISDLRAREIQEREQNRQKDQRDEY